MDRQPKHSFFILFAACVLAVATASDAAANLLPRRAQAFLYYLEETGKRSDYLSVWERVADSLILSSAPPRDCA